MSDKSASLLTVNIQHRVGTLSLDIALALTQPWTVLFGPSGSGKTTVLRAIAGFVRPNAGRIAFGPQLLVDSVSNSCVPAHLRPVRSAAQTARLFPHMTIRKNILYGSDWTAKPSEEAALAAEIMTLFRINQLAERLPADLSGGERQRTSAARALFSATTFTGPTSALLLLDEPFAGLDTTMRDQLLAELQAWVTRRKIPVLSVTHDIGEAFQLNAEVIKISEGKVIAQGPASEILETERATLLAQLQLRSLSAQS